MKYLLLPTLTLLALFWGTAAFAQDAVKAEDGFFLPTLEKMAHDDGDKIFTICEIFNGESRTAVIRPNIRCHNAYSIAKLFTVATLGIMEDEGLLDIDEEVYPILKDKFPENFDPKWRDVKISATFYLASRIAEAKSGEKLNVYMIRKMLDPLEFSEYAFSTDPQGSPIGATGLYTSTEDMAKLGLVFVQNGVYKDKRILSQRFVDEAFERTFELYPVGDEGVAFVKGGMNGQLLYMNRKTKRVVAIHSYLGDVDAILNFLIKNDK